jgi:Double-stranded RNA binding motif
MSHFKTAISLLQEFCTKQGAVLPYYEFNGEEMAEDNTKNFRFTVRGLGLESFGTGKSKRDAKQVAAHTLLELLPEAPKSKLLDGHSFELDAISRLTNLCNQSNLPAATFEVLSMSGSPHLPQFEISCHVATIKKSAFYSSKKGAKQLAAQKLLEAIQKIVLPVEDLSELEAKEDTNQKLFEKYRQTRKGASKKQPDDIDKRHHFFVQLYPEKQACCRAVANDENIHEPATKVELMLEALQLEYKVCDVEGREWPMRSFELVNANYDCFLLFPQPSFYSGLLDYLKTMLSL